MKFRSKRELQQIEFNHSSNIDFRDFMNLYKKCTAERYSSLAIDTLLPLHNPLHFRKNPIEKIQKLIMTVDDTIEMKNCKMILKRSSKNISFIIR